MFKYASLNDFGISVTGDASPSDISKKCPTFDFGNNCHIDLGIRVTGTNVDTNLPVMEICLFFSIFGNQEHNEINVGEKEKNNTLTTTLCSRCRPGRVPRFIECGHTNG